MSQSPESEGLLNGQASFDRNLHIASERDELLADDGLNAVYSDDATEMGEELFVPTARAEDHDSDTEINILHQKNSEHVTVTIDSELSVRSLHSL